MGTMDAMGYDAETSDPLYKHIPFCLSVRPERGGAVRTGYRASER